MNDKKHTKRRLPSKTKQAIAFLIMAMCQHNAICQSGFKLNNIEYMSEMSGTASGGDYAPFWLTSNKYGLSSIENNSGYIRGCIFRDIENDSLKKWRFGFGADIVIPANYTSNFVVEQLYADIQYKRVRLSIGSKEREMELKNQKLSSGGLTNSINARPIPQVRIEVPEFWTIPGTGNWLALKGHIAYGAFTDNNWQKDFAAEKTKYSANVLYHSKAGFLRIGNEEKFPITFIGGLEMQAQFGGEVWNIGKRADDTSDFDGSHVKLDNGLGSFLNVLFPGGSDPRDGDYKNIEGNQLGSWHFSLEYKNTKWSLRAYAEHFFEDHSQMFFQYGWKDMLYGIEIKLPRNRFISNILYEHIGTADQTGGLYHDHTSILPDQISGKDNYYNHSMYAGWMHWGQTIGNPLLISPIYNKDKNIQFYHNRINAHHIAICGSPTNEIDYRLMFTHMKSLGTYDIPLVDPQYANFFMAEATYSPQRLNRTSFTLSFGTNGGQIIGEGAGAMLTIRKTALITR